MYYVVIHIIYLYNIYIKKLANWLLNKEYFSINGIQLFVTDV